MGFRNPVTSATAVDTGDTAGVRVYGNAANPGSGVVRWYVGGTTATAQLDGSQSGSGGSLFHVGLDGGGATLNLNREGAPTGGYLDVARLTAPNLVSLEAPAVELPNDPAWATYTPVWACAGAAPSLGNGVLKGRWRRRGRLVDVHVYLAAGSTTTGGTLGTSFSLPVAARNAPGETFLLAKLYAAGNGSLWIGYGQVAPNATVATVWFPTSASSSALGQLSNAGSSNIAGSGVPAISGQYVLPNGANVVVCGSYEAAAAS